MTLYYTVSESFFLFVCAHNCFVLMVNHPFYFSDRSLLKSWCPGALQQGCTDSTQLTIIVFGLLRPNAFLMPASSVCARLRLYIYMYTYVLYTYCTHIYKVGGSCSVSCDSRLLKCINQSEKLCEKTCESIHIKERQCEHKAGSQKLDY